MTDLGEVPETGDPGTPEDPGEPGEPGEPREPGEPTEPEDPTKEPRLPEVSFEQAALGSQQAATEGDTDPVRLWSEIDPRNQVLVDPAITPTYDPVQDTIEPLLEEAVLQDFLENELGLFGEEEDPFAMFF